MSLWYSALRNEFVLEMYPISPATNTERTLTVSSMISKSGLEARGPQPRSPEVRATGKSPHLEWSAGC